MTQQEKENKKLMLQIRISILEARGSHNNPIVKKLKRKLRSLEAAA